MTNYASKLRTIARNSRMLEMEGWERKAMLEAASVLERTTAERDALAARLAEAEAKIDALMLEYCPAEMTQEQVDRWMAHQVATDSASVPPECAHNWWPSAYENKRVVQKTCAKCSATVTVTPGDSADVAHEKIATVDAPHQYDPLRAFAEGEAEGDCSYGDGCPPVARHYRCVSCKARLALLNADRMIALRELAAESQALGLYDTTVTVSADGGAKC